MSLKALFLFLFTISCTSLYSQSIKGKVQSGGKPVYNAAIRIVENNSGTYSNEDGSFTTDSLAPGKYSLEVTLLGYQKSLVKVDVPGAPVKISLKENTTSISQVTITGSTNARRLNESPVPVKAIDIGAIKNRALDVNQILSQSAGVKVQQDGGLGSFTNVRINGLDDKSVQFFIDGMPLLFQGFILSRGINNVPFNLLERIEIYKGAVPIEFGGDVLGGGINLVTSKRPFSYIEVTNQVGSFNTWRSSFSGKYVHKKSGAYFGLNAYQNYSDNSYVVDVELINANGNPDSIKAKRFHDRFRSVSVQGEAGIQSKNGRNKLSIGQHFFQADKQIQHKFTNLTRAIGGAQLGEKGRTTEIRAKADSVLNIPLSVNLLYRNSQFTTVYIDTTKKIYNWLGEVTGNKTFGGGELGFAPFNSRIQTNSYLVRPTIKYAIKENHVFSVSATRTSAERSGVDTTAKKFYIVDPFANTQHLQKLIAGIGYEAKFLKGRIGNVISGRYYEMRGNGDNALFFMNALQSFKTVFRGWSESVKVAIWPEHLFAKTTFEHVARLPDEYELFGDGVFIYANPKLQPESNRNLLSGLIFNWQKKIDVEAEFTYIRRDVKNFIRLVPAPNFAQYQNVQNVIVRGYQFEIKVKPVKWFIMEYNLTKLEKRDRTDTVGANAEAKRFYNALIPNEPLYMYNATTTFNLKNVFRKEDDLQFVWSGNFTRWYYLFYEADGDPQIKLRVPSQFIQNAGVNYGVNNNQLAFSFEVHNLGNIKRIDRYGLQNPYRSYNFKVRWFIPFKEKVKLIQVDLIE